MCESSQRSVVASVTGPSRERCSAIGPGLGVQPCVHAAGLVFRRKFMKRMTGSIIIPRAVLAIAAAMVLTLLCVSSARAQIDTGAVLGTVTDASGAEVRGATVTLTNEGTNAALSTTTGSSGDYKFSPVNIGTYTVSVNYTGFTTMTQRHVTVNVDAQVVANFALKPGAVTETIEVASTTPVLETQDASVGQVIDQRNVDNLPLNGRNFTF